MTRTRLLGAFIASLPFSGTLSLLLGQTPGASIEQQLRSQYRIASVGSNGVVVRAGTVVVVQQDGITALPAPGEYPCNSHKEGGRISHSAICTINYRVSKDTQRPLQVGEKAYLTAIQVKPSEIIFKVQTCCGGGNDAPFRAAVSFQFPKGSLDSTKLKDIQDAIGQIFVPDTSSSDHGPEQSPANTPQGAPSEKPRAAPLKLPAAYSSSQNPTDKLQLNADNTFSLQEGGQAYQGTFAASGNTLKLNITGGPKTTATIQGNNLTDSGGQVWVLGDQPARSAAGDAVLQNQDVIKLVKAGLDDTLIIAKIGSSKCQFDTSTDALIQLKQSGASAAVLKAIMGAGK